MKSCRRIVAVTAIVFAEIAQRKAIQMPAMSRVTEGTEIGVVRSNKNSAPARGQHAMELFHSSDHIAHMLDYMNGPDLPERVVSEWKRIAIEVGDNIGPGVSVAIEPNRSGIFVDAAADVQNRQESNACWGRSCGFKSRTYCCRASRHCSSVSTAKSA